MKKLLFPIISHLIFAAAGFAAGIFALPILTAPPSATDEQMKIAAEQATFKGDFVKDLAGSDFLHWGEGKVSIGSKFISLQGKIAAGPDYKLYLSPEFVTTEPEFLQYKEKMVQVGDVKTFENFVISVPETIKPASYNSVIIWCESFGEFITAARYQ